MTTFNPSALPTVDDKTQSLSRFVATHLSDGAEITVIARSVESPIVKAIDASRAEIAAAGVSIRAIFLQSNIGNWGEGDGTSSRDVRLALNPRLLEAHEQVVISPTAVWIGDCMRRDPVKRDAFSQEKVGCAVTAKFAVLSFEKLWAISTPALSALVSMGSVPAVARQDASR
jgi:hypothetical protein